MTKVITVTVKDDEAAEKVRAFAAGLMPRGGRYMEMPKDCERYWLINSSGGVHRLNWQPYDYDVARFNFGNCYRDEASATKARDYQIALMKVRRYAAEHFPFVPDWEDGTQAKAYIMFSVKALEHYVRRTYVSKAAPYGFYVSLDRIHDFLAAAQRDLADELAVLAGGDE